jgi:hypothetical protein
MNENNGISAINETNDINVFRIKYPASSIMSIARLAGITRVTNLTRTTVLA